MIQNTSFKCRFEPCTYEHTKKRGIANHQRTCTLDPKNIAKTEAIKEANLTKARDTLESVKEILKSKETAQKQLKSAFGSHMTTTRINKIIGILNVKIVSKRTTSIASGKREYVTTYNIIN